MTRTRPLILCLLAAAALAASAGSAQAAGCDTWHGPGGNGTLATSGTWGVASNWSTDAIPLSTDDVCITVPGTYTVTLAPFTIAGPDGQYAGDNVNSLTLGASSGAQTLIISGAASISNSNETVNDTTLNLAAASTINPTGTLVLDSTAGGTPAGGSPPASAYGGGATIGGGPLLNSGHIITQVEDTNAGAGTFFALGSFTNAAGASVDDNSGVLTDDVASPYSWTATNAGTITVAAGASWVLTLGLGGSADFTNNGVVANNGSVTVSNATWTQSGGSESGNAVVLQTGATLADSVGSATFLQDYGTVTDTGTIPVGQTVTVMGAPYSSGGETYYSTTASLGGATLVNDGTLVFDAPGTSSTSGGAVFVGDGSITNNGTVNAEVTNPAWAVHLQAGLANSHTGTVNVSGGALDQDNGTATSNDGVVTVGPGAQYALLENSSFTNASDGTVAPEIASASSFGSFSLSGACCQGPGTFVAGGTLAPVLTGGFAPAANEEFQLFALSGGKFTGTFAALGVGFSADYAQEGASPAYVGAIYHATPPPPPPPPVIPTAQVLSISGGHAKIVVKLSCVAGASSACATVSVTAKITEHLKAGKLKAISARKKYKAKTTTKQVVIASASVTLSAGSTKTLTLTLNATGLKLLKKYGHLTTVVSVVSGGKTPQSATVHVSKAVKHKPKKKKK